MTNTNNKEKKVSSQIIEIDKTKNGKLTVSSQVIKKLIYGTLISENYQVNLSDIEVINKENANLETQIRVLVSKKSNLIELKEQIIKLILKRIDAVLNVNINNVSLIFTVK